MNHDSPVEIVLSVGNAVDREHYYMPPSCLLLEHESVYPSFSFCFSTAGHRMASLNVSISIARRS